LSLSKLAEKLYPVFIKTSGENIIEPCRLFLSASSMKEKATVCHAVCDTPEEAWETALDNLEKILAQKNITPVILRADWVIKSESKTWAQCLTLAGAKRRNWFRQGIALDPNYNLAFTEQELNANLFFFNPDKEKTKGEFQPNNAEFYCQQRFGRSFPQMTDASKVEIFDTAGAFIQDDMSAPLIMTGKGLSIGRRNIAADNSEIFIDMAMNAAKYLVTQCGSDGKFVYGLYPCNDSIAPGYNTHRHFGTLFSMAEAYEFCADENEKKALGNAIENGLEYGIRTFLRNAKNSDGQDIAYFIEGRVTTIGISGLSLLAFTKWTTASGTQKYIPLMQAVARGILAVQKPEGNFSQILNATDFSVRKDFSITFYDGEALYGMLRLYAITKESYLLEAVERAVRYFRDAKYWEHHDHWMQYTLNELTIYKPKAEYFQFGLDNISSYLSKISKSTVHAPTQLEMVMAAENMIRRMKSLPEMSELAKRISNETLYSTADKRAERMENSYFWSEVAMYFYNPARMVGSFFIRGDAFRVRIDDVQHTISGLLAYNKCLRGEKVPFAPVEDIAEEKVTEEKPAVTSANNRTVIKAGNVRVTIEAAQADPIKIETDQARNDFKELLRVGVLRKNKPRVLAPDSPLYTMFYVAKHFDVELFMFTPKDIDFANKTANAITLEGTKKIQKIIPLPKIIDNPASIFGGDYSKELKELAKDYYFTRSPMNSSKQNIYNMLLAEGRFKDFLIDTHTLKDFEHFRTLFAQYSNDVILKPAGSNEGKGVARISLDGGQYVINLKTDKINLKTVDELKTFYDEHFSSVKYVLQPYIVSRTHLGNPFDIRIHTRRGAEGKFKVLPYPRIGNENGVVSNVGSGGYTMNLDSFLKTEFGNDSEAIYNAIMNLGNNFPEYYQSFFKTQLFDVGIDVGIQKRGNSYELKIFEVNTYCGGSFVRVEDAITRFEYFHYINQKLRDGSLK